MPIHQRNKNRITFQYYSLFQQQKLTTNKTIYVCSEERENKKEQTLKAIEAIKVEEEDKLETADDIQSTERCQRLASKFEEAISFAKWSRRIDDECFNNRKADQNNNK
ncbi:hypothetical protein CEXT_141321 [Caerostris extrusa]|uniref:Uncharacterized protein n=1 Tax=Caerostris extrusa TaxID=172846 RepID=A0AAV4WCK9_CAEEX|nr:hypothetical protein CEXT_141321 [Caerostris extrusa]